MIPAQGVQGRKGPAVLFHLRSAEQFRPQRRILAGVLFFVSALGTAVADAFGVFVIFRMMGGIGVGIAVATGVLPGLGKTPVGFS